jgi:hypothetical protein
MELILTLLIAVMTVFETIKKIAASSGYHLYPSKAHPMEGYVLKQQGSSCPDGIFQSLDEVIVYLMAQSQNDGHINR